MIAVTESAQEDTETEIEAEAQEQPLRRSTCARTQAIPRTSTQGQSTSAARSTPSHGPIAPRPAPVRIHKDYT